METAPRYRVRQNVAVPALPCQTKRIARLCGAVEGLYHFSWVRAAKRSKLLNGYYDFQTSAQAKFRFLWPLLSLKQLLLNTNPWKSDGSTKAFSGLFIAFHSSRNN